MTERTTTELEYVPRELFDMHLQSIRERANSDKEISDEKFDKFQMILEKNLAEYKTMITEVNGRIDVLEEKLEHTTDTLTVAINGVNSRIDSLEKRIDDVHQSLSLWLGIMGFLIAVVPIAVAVVQSFIK